MILNLLTGRRVACTHESLGFQKLVPLDLVSDCEAGCVKTEVCDCEAGCVRTLVALIWMSPRIVKSLISRAVKTLHSLLSFLRSSVLAGNEVHFSVTRVQVWDCNHSFRQLAKCGS